MTQLLPTRKFALVLADSTTDLERCCEPLIRGAYEVLSFLNGEDASAWLEEDTPAIAVIAPSVDPYRDHVIQTLNERTVRVRYLD